MTDIVDQLRTIIAPHLDWREMSHCADVVRRAADEIERLRTETERLRAEIVWLHSELTRARLALGGDPDADNAADEIERLRAALREAIEGWEDGANYKGDYLREKHRDAEGIADARAVLNGTKGTHLSSNQVSEENRALPEGQKARRND